MQLNLPGLLVFVVKTYSMLKLTTSHAINSMVDIKIPCHFPDFNDTEICCKNLRFRSLQSLWRNQLDHSTWTGKNDSEWIVVVRYVMLTKWQKLNSNTWVLIYNFAIKNLMRETSVLTMVAPFLGPLKTGQTMLK